MLQELSVVEYKLACTTRVVVKYIQGGRTGVNAYVI